MNHTAHNNLTKQTIDRWQLPQPGKAPPQPKLTAIKNCDHYIEEHYKIKEVRAPRNNQEHSLMPLDDSPVIHTLY